MGRVLGTSSNHISGFGQTYAMHSVAVSFLGWSVERGAGRLDAELDISEVEADGFKSVESDRRPVGRTPRMNEERVTASERSPILEVFESCLIMGGYGLSPLLIATCLLMTLGAPNIRRSTSCLESVGERVEIGTKGKRRQARHVTSAFAYALVPSLLKWC